MTPRLHAECFNAELRECDTFQFMVWDTGSGNIYMFIVTHKHLLSIVFRSLRQAQCLVLMYDNAKYARTQRVKRELGIRVKIRLQNGLSIISLSISAGFRFLSILSYNIIPGSPSLSGTLRKKLLLKAEASTISMALWHHRCVRNPIDIPLETFLLKQLPYAMATVLLFWS